MFPIASDSEDSNGYKNAGLSALQHKDGFDIAMVVIREDCQIGCNMTLMYTGFHESSKGQLPDLGLLMYLRN